MGQVPVETYGLLVGKGSRIEPIRDEPIREEPSPIHLSKVGATDLNWPKNRAWEGLEY